MARGMMAKQAPAAAPPQPDTGPNEAQDAADAKASVSGSGDSAETEGGAAQPGAQQQGQQATPEEQAAYENFIHMAVQIIYNGGKVNQAILDRLAFRHGSAPESVQAVIALASATVAVVTRVQDILKQNNAKIDPSVMYHASSEVMNDLADLAGKPNPKTGKPIHVYTEEEGKGAWIRAVDQYQQTQTQSGDLHKQQMQHDWGEIVGAAKAGNLGAISPALAGIGGKGGPPPAQGAAPPAPAQAEGP